MLVSLDEQSLDVAQHEAGLALKYARALMERDELVESRRGPQHAAIVEAHVAVTAT